MASPLSSEDVRKVATLSRLNLSPDESSRIAGELGAVLEYVAMLDEVDTDDIEPMAHAVELTNVLRDDAERQSLPREAALANAPKNDGTCFLVPPILSGS